MSNPSFFFAVAGGGVSPGRSFRCDRAPAARRPAFDASNAALAPVPAGNSLPLFFFNFFFFFFFCCCCRFFFLFCFPLHFFLFDYFFVCFFLFCFILFPIELSTAPMSRSGRTRCQSSCSNCCFPPWTSNSPPTGPADLTCPATKTSKNESNPSSIAGRPSASPSGFRLPFRLPFQHSSNFFFFKLYRK